ADLVNGCVVLCVGVSCEWLVKLATDHVGVGVHIFDVPREPFRDECFHEAPRSVVRRGLERGGRDELSDHARGDDACTCLQPFRRALLELVKYGECHAPRLHARSRGYDGTGAYANPSMMRT